LPERDWKTVELADTESDGELLKSEIPTRLIAHGDRLYRAGPDFTNVGLNQSEGFPQLESLLLIDCAITREAEEELVRSTGVRLLPPVILANMPELF
jgi:hypothetical protein